MEDLLFFEDTHFWGIAYLTLYNRPRYFLSHLLAYLTLFFTKVDDQDETQCQLTGTNSERKA
jgi:hypothetical protein